MTRILSDPVIPRPAKVQKAAVDKWIKRHGLKNTQDNRTRAKERIRENRRRKTLPTGREISTIDAVQSWQVVYGRAVIGGQYIFRKGDKSSGYYDLVIALACHEIDAIEKLFLDGNEIQFGASPDPRWAVGRYANRVFMTGALGTEDQSVMGELNARYPDYWTANHRGQGHALAYIIGVFTADVFPNGDPDISLQVRGKKIYDPRVGGDPAWGYGDAKPQGENPALIGADLLTDTKFGFGHDWSLIDTSDTWGGLQYAANACDQDQALKAGGTERRYAMGGYFNLERSRKDVLDKIKEAMGGDICWIDGLWRFFPGVAAPAATITLTPDDLRGEMKVRAFPSLHENFNSVRGTFVKTTGRAVTVTPDVGANTLTSAAAHKFENDQAVKIRSTGDLPFPLLDYQIYYVTEATSTTFKLKDWGTAAIDIQSAGSGTIEVYVDGKYEETDFPGVSVAAYVAEDNDEKTYGDYQFPFTQSGTMAQRLARIRLEWTRRGIELRAAFSLKAYPLMKYDRVILAGFDAYGWTSQEFLVIANNTDFGADSDGLCDLALKQYDDNIYAWTPATDEQTVRESPTTSLSNPFVATPPTDLALSSGDATLDVRQDGTAFARLGLAWTAPADAFVNQIEIQFKKATDSTWRNAPAVAATETSALILDVLDGVAYEARIRSHITATGVRSAWVTPAGGAHIVLGKSAPPADIASLTIAIVDGKPRFTWAANTDKDLSHYVIKYGASWAVGTVIHDDFRGTVYRWDHLTAGTYTIRVKAVDTSRNESTNDTTGTLTITAPGAVRNLRSAAINNNFELRWLAPATGTLPIDHYLVYKGTVTITNGRIEGGTLIGERRGTFFAGIEKIGGLYTYSIVPVDTGANLGAVATVSARVYDPADFKLKFDELIKPERAYTENVLVGMRGSNLFDSIPDDIDDEVDISCWLDAAHGVTMSDLVPVGVTSIADQSGQATAFTQSDINMRPTLGTLNGRLALVFDGTQELEGGQLSELVGAAVKNFTIAFSADEVASRIIFYSGVNFALLTNAAGQLLVYNNDNGGGADQILFGPISAGATYIVSVKHSAGLMEAWCYGSDGLVDYGSVATGDTWLLTHACYLGGFGGEAPGPARFSGKIAAVYFSKVANDYHLRLVEQLFFARYLYDPARFAWGFEQGKFWAPANLTETWQEHFDDNSAANIQDLIDAGLERYFQPGTTDPATFSIEWDLGLVLTSQLVAVDWSEADFGTAATVVPQLDTSLDRETWSENPAQDSVYVDSVRYVRISFTITPTDNMGACEVDLAKLKLKVKQITISGKVAIADTAGAGETVAFARTVLDIEKITASPRSTDGGEVIPVWDDTPNPTSFKLKAYDKDGNRVACTASYDAIVLVPAEEETL